MTSSAVFNVVVNGEGQHSVWPTTRPLPEGWRSTGFVGTRAECLDHIDLVWTDMRPVSARGEAR
ncbi:MbtH family protein [Actinokineospora sp. 24-640]